MESVAKGPFPAGEELLVLCLGALVAVVKDGFVVSDSGQLHGRSRRLGIGFTHHRPEKRQRAWVSSTASSCTTTGRGHDISTAATIAASSSLEGDVSMLAFR